MRPHPAAPAGVPSASTGARAPHVEQGGKHVLYPNHYAWYVLVSTLDLVMTNTVIHHFNAREVNTIADRAIALFGFWGLIGLKFATVVVVVLICEYVGRRRHATGRRVAAWAIAISAIPVIIAAAQVMVLKPKSRPLERQILEESGMLHALPPERR
ncbi:MAG: hypothetical protein H7Y88_05915 [Phycisphaerales bacterium]|nr:hypothetical protein [Phycisphaerales bacterium]